VARGSALRWLAYGLAASFFVATLLQLADQLNLIYQPPTIPDSANLVDRVTALIPYRQQVWPLFAAANGLFALGFLVLIGLGIVLAARAGVSGDRRHLLIWLIATAGVVGAIGQLVLVGAVKASIDIPYCDCGFKDQEIVSQVWAEMVVQSAVQVLIYAAGLLAAGGLVVAGTAVAELALPPTWRLLSYVAAIMLVVSVALGWADVGGDASTWLTAAVTGLLIPIWAIWLGRSVPAVVARPADVATTESPA